MILSKAAGYGIRALVYLARHPKSQLCGLQKIARSERIPPIFLRKVLGELRRHQLLLSLKGIHGGYSLDRSADSITLWEVVDSLGDSDEFDLCILGCGYCSSDDPCALHQEWQGLREQMLHSWQAKTISEIAAASEARRGDQSTPEMDLAVSADHNARRDRLRRSK
ncbi:MAG: Rrf2 family transcriptional regulator [Acidobacteria bacterium]|nr:Rrf2 family transcriptional regulator [Acidobacteriota bacterium]